MASTFPPRLPHQSTQTHSPGTHNLTVVILVADGIRPDVLRTAIDSGDLPALGRLRHEGEFCEVTTTFPSVTGPAYTPFLMGKHPCEVGLPGIRWFDRARAVPSLAGHSRSYVGHEMRHINSDLAPGHPTAFELVPGSVGALSVITRGLPHSRRIGGGIRFALRAAKTHFTGDVGRWLDIDRDVGAEVARSIRTLKPDFVFAALTGADKTSHATGHASTMVLEALRIVDHTAATIVADAERDGRWRDLHLWVVSDHGHSPVQQHDDLERAIEALDFRTLSHPWTLRTSADVAVMVSGNAMVHLYVELDQRKRPFWNKLGSRWEDFATAVLGRDSVDLMLLPLSPGSCEVRSRERGTARLDFTGGRFDYRTITGDPLGVGDLSVNSRSEALAAMSGSDYPDGLVQIAHIAACERSGDLILSAMRQWDFRARYEPIPHVSSHGALHREHMLVPLLVNRPPVRTPERTVDVMPSVMRALGVEVPAGVEGVSFLG